jgi:methyltransferase (TIGR00027 family)
VARGLGEQLPEDARLVVDPYGFRFAESWLRLLAALPRFFARLLEPLIVGIQLRTKIVDDVLASFVREGGEQVVLLGAGYDCRALRFADVARFFEVDLAATQARKRALAPSRAHYVAFDFEGDVATLTDILGASGFDRMAPALTIWEGVAVYLSDAAVDATVRAIASWSAPRSALVFSYYTLDALARTNRGLMQRMLRREPLRSGFDPAVLPAWLGERGFQMIADVSVTDLAQSFLPPRLQKVVVHDGIRFGVARRA